MCHTALVLPILVTQGHLGKVINNHLVSIHRAIGRLSLYHLEEFIIFMVSAEYYLIFSSRPLQYNEGFPNSAAQGSNGLHVQRTWIS